MSKNETTKNIDRLLDVEMEVTVRFGLTEIPLHEVVNFESGSMIELNRTVDEPVELLVNNFPFARGEVVVVDGYYSVRITEIELPPGSGETLLSNTAKVQPKDVIPQNAPPKGTSPQNAKPPKASPPAAGGHKPDPQKPVSPNPDEK